MHFSNNGLGVRDIVLQLRNDNVGVGDDSVGVCDITVDVRNGYVGVY